MHIYIYIYIYIYAVRGRRQSRLAARRISQMFRAVTGDPAPHDTQNLAGQGAQIRTATAVPEATARPIPRAKNTVLKILLTEMLFQNSIDRQVISRSTLFCRTFAEASDIVNRLEACRKVESRLQREIVTVGSSDASVCLSVDGNKSCEEGC